MQTYHASKFQLFNHEIQFNKVAQPIACDQVVLLPFLRAPPGNTKRTTDRRLPWLHDRVDKGAVSDPPQWLSGSCVRALGAQLK